MSLMRFPTFGGIMPKVNPRHLPQLAAQTAQNTWLSETTIVPLKEPSVVEAVAAGSESIYLWRRGGATEWLSWAGDVDVRQGPISEDQYSRIYYTDGSTLHMKLWDGGVAVTVPDVSMTPPSAPFITKTPYFDPSIRVTAWHKGIQMNIVGYSWDGDVLTMTFREEGHEVELEQGVYWLDVWDGSVSQNLPANGATLPMASQGNLYSERVTVMNGLTKFAEVQVVAVDYKNFDFSWVPPAGSQVTQVPHDVVITCNMNMARTTTQYQYYVQTLVDQYGQESPPSPVSNIVTWEPNDILSVLTNAGAGIYARIYRSATGLSDSKFYFVAQVNPGDSYIDQNTDAMLAETMPLIENPPANLTGLVSLPGGFFAAFNGNDVYFSEPFLPYSWPTRYRVTMDFKVVGLAVSGNDLIVMTAGNPYFISGTHPDILSVTKLPIEQACISKRSIAFAENYVCYASPDGLVGGAAGDFRVVSGDHYTQEQWQALTPQDMIGSVHDGRYIGFIATGGLIFDFRSGDALKLLTTTDQMATGVFADIETDQLYLIQGTDITEWRGGTNPLLATWHSKQFQAIRSPIWNSALVIAETYTGTIFKMFADGNMVWSYAVTGEHGFRIPKLPRYENWSMQIESVDTVCEVIMATAMTDLRTGTAEEPLR